MKSKAFLITGMIASFIVASTLSVYPLQHALASIRPSFMVMVMIFWVMYRSSMMSVWAVFLVGLASDLLLGTHLGYQAFCAVLTALVLRIMMLYSKELTLVQAWFGASVGLCVYQVALWILHALAYGEFSFIGFGSLLSSILFFPVVWLALHWINKQVKERAY